MSKDWKELFSEPRWVVYRENSKGEHCTVGLEGIYQAFKERFMDELCALLPKDELFDLQIPLKDKKK